MIRRLRRRRNHIGNPVVQAPVTGGRSDGGGFVQSRLQPHVEPCRRSCALAPCPSQKGLERPPSFLVQSRDAGSVETCPAGQAEERSPKGPDIWIECDDGLEAVDCDKMAFLILVPKKRCQAGESEPLGLSSPDPHPVLRASS